MARQSFVHNSNPLGNCYLHQMFREDRIYQLRSLSRGLQDPQLCNAFQADMVSS